MYLLLTLLSDSLSDQPKTVGGAVGTASHGSSFAHGTMSDSIASLVLVAPNGQDIVELTNNGNSRALLQAARVGLGRLGVLVEIRLKVARAYKVRRKEQL